MSEISLDGGKTRILTENCFDNIKTKGRPRKKLNSLGEKIIEQLASYMCTEEEIASFLGVSAETLKTKDNNETFSECIKKGRQKGKASLRMSQFRIAKTNATMAIFLGKQFLGQSDEGVIDNKDDNGLNGKNGTAGELKIVVEKRIVDLSKGGEDGDNQL